MGLSLTKSISILSARLVGTPENDATSGRRPLTVNEYVNATRYFVTLQIVEFQRDIVKLVSTSATLDDILEFAIDLYKEQITSKRRLLRYMHVSPNESGC